MNAIRWSYIILSIAVVIIWSPAATAQDAGSGHFVPEEHPEIMEVLNAHESAQGVADALVDAGANWTQLWGALESIEGTLWTHGCWLIANMPHLDRLEMTKNTFLEHVRFAYATRTDLPYKVPDELFREYILTYRIGDEPVRPWRSAIWFEHADLKGDTMTNTARRINQWVFENLKVRERGFFGPRPDPLSIIAAGSGTQSDIATVAIAMCKTFGVAARQTSLAVPGEESDPRTWLEIYTDDGRWVPMYPDNPGMFGNPRWIEHEKPHNVTVVSSSSAFTSIQVTSNYTPTGTIKLLFTRNGESVPDWESFSISAWNDGAWLPLDDLGFDLEESRMSAEKTEGFEAILGDGFYLVQAGARNARGDAYVQTFPVSLDAGEVVELTIQLDIPASESESVDLVQRTIDPLPQALLDQLGGIRQMSIGLLDGESVERNFTCVVVFDPSSEPSTRMLPLIAAWAKNAGASLLGVGEGNADEAEAAWNLTMGDEIPTPFRFQADTDGSMAAGLGITPDADGKFAGLPFVMLLSPDNKPVYVWEGYNLAVSDGLQRAMELSE